MVVFCYDKSFEGLLSTVFEAYRLNVFPDKLLREGDIIPLFTQEVYTIGTEEAKASRVWKGLEKKLSKSSCNMISHVWLSECEENDELIFRYIRKVIDCSNSIETNFADTDVLEMHQLAKRVSQERLRMLQFVRFQKAADGIFFAPVFPMFNVLPLVIAHFIDRFADQKWVIYDMKRRYGYFYDLKTAVEITIDNDVNFPDGKLGESIVAEDELMFQELWKRYFKSMTIKERINLNLQRQHMPKRFWKFLTEKQ